MSLIPWMLMAAGSVAVDCINPITQPGESGYVAEQRHHLRFLMENDSAAGSDCNYTHGTRIDYARNFSQDPNHAFGLSFTQNIYTPQTHTRGAVPGEHPYAGYMALGVAYLTVGEYVGNSVEFQLGTTGKTSGAREMQDMIHKAFHIDRWEGWSDQIRDEVTFQLTARQDYRLACLETQLPWGMQTAGALFTREELGTVSIAAELGGYIRMGRNLPPSMQYSCNRAADFSIGLLQTPDYDPTASSWYLQAGASVKYVARNLFIDGGVFHDFDRTCSRMPWLGEAQLGLGVRHRGVDYFAGVIARTDYYRGQTDDTVFATFNFAFHW